MTALNGLELYNALRESKSWDSWENYTDKYVTFGALEANVKVVAIEIPKDNGGYDGYASQGWTGEAKMIFQVEHWYTHEIEHYAKRGTVDSYYGVNWDGTFKPVVAKKKEVYVYE